MQMILEARVGNLEMLMAEVIELCRELKLEAAERDRRDEERNRREKEEKAERDRKEAEQAQREKEEKAERDRKEAEQTQREKEEKAEQDRKWQEYIRQEKEAMEAFRQEMREKDARFKEWLEQDKEEREKARKAFERQVNKAIGDSSNKFGTLVENLIAPGAKPLIRQYFKCEPDDFRVRAMKRNGGKKCEVDVLLICEDKAFMIEVKSKPDDRDVMKILAKAKTLTTFFNECVGKQIIPMLASTFIEEDIINLATSNGLHVVAYRQWEYLDILNFDAINEKNKDKDTPLT
ncbi:MAG: hypothetical protein HQL05_11760 [Nitrospirae bacterium]|uniref:hypothetical protein n=1 Tax=Candidatus Magnetobacterium casense TaxID=1455061 RepID=UPI00058B4047|nr:hypothetical protein [Candidatus Magnetobacterium casensis]MBF0338494.1 hypothetical protein [Nitrospirota bacterium]